MRKNKIFCRGLICDKWNRKITCVGCGKYLCNLCEVRSENKKIFCPNCYIKSFSPDWNRLNKEFDEMIQNIFGPKKNEIETVVKV